MQHIDLAAHFDDVGRLAKQLERHVPQCTQIRGDIFAFYAVAPGRALHESAVLEAQARRQPVDLGLGDEYQIGRVITIVEVVRPDDNVGLRVRAGQYPWVTLGMLRAAEKIVESQIGGSE